MWPLQRGPKFLYQCASSAQWAWWVFSLLGLAAKGQSVAERAAGMLNVGWGSKDQSLSPNRAGVDEIWRGRKERSLRNKESNEWIGYSKIRNRLWLAWEEAVLICFSSVNTALLEPSGTVTSTAAPLIQQETVSNKCENRLTPPRVFYGKSTKLEIGAEFVERNCCRNRLVARWCMTLLNVTFVSNLWLLWQNGSLSIRSFILLDATSINGSIARLPIQPKYDGILLL